MWSDEPNPTFRSDASSVTAMPQPGAVAQAPLPPRDLQGRFRDRNEYGSRRMRALGRLVVSVSLCASVFAVPSEARADEGGIDYEAIVKDVARENFARLRRGIVIGPRVGVAGVYPQGSGELDAELSGGLAFYRLNVPFTFEVYKSVVDRTKSLVRERIAAMISEGKTPSVEEITTIATTLYHEVERELLGREPRRDRTFEKPVFGITLDGGYLPREGTGRARIGVSTGFWHVVAGLSAGAFIGPRPTGLLGAELGLRALGGPGPRPFVYEAFTRIELPAPRRDKESPYWSVGVRTTFDVL